MAKASSAANMYGSMPLLSGRSVRAPAAMSICAHTSCFSGAFLDWAAACRAVAPASLFRLFTSGGGSAASTTSSASTLPHMAQMCPGV